MDRIVMELILMKDLPDEVKQAILKELGYGSKGIFVVNKDGEQVLDRYTREPVRLDNMLILPGSEVIIDNNPLSIACYFEEYGDVV
jgi:hypothetical protein